MIPDSRKTPKVMLSKKEQIARKLEMDLEGEEDNLLQIVKLQSLDGSFDMNDTICGFLQLDVHTLQEHKPKHLKYFFHEY